MSDDAIKSVDSTENVPEVQVSQDAYKKVTSDMHRFKTEAKNLQAKLAEIQADQEAKENAVLREKEEWSQLYKKAETKLKAIETERAQEKSKFTDSHKLNAALQALGGLKQSGYNSFIQVGNIQVEDDGSINAESVAQEVDRFRREHPELLKVNSKQALPSDAPRAFANKTLSNMSADEMAEARRQAVSNLKAK